MKTLFALTILLLCLVLQPQPVFAEVPAKIKVGAILSLTGPTADYGQSMQKSMDLALKDLGSNSITVIYEDAAYEPHRAVTAFQKLRSVDKVDVVYVWGVSFCKAIAPLAEANRIPMIGQCVDQATTRGRKYVLRFMNSTPEYVQTVAQYLKTKNFKRIGVVLSENAYIEENFSVLQNSPEITLVNVDRFQAAERDFRASILKMRKLGVDAVAVYLLAGQISQFYRQARELGWSIPTFGTNFFESESEIRLAEGAMEGAVYPNNFVEPEFRKRFEEEFGKTTQLGFGALSYDFIFALNSLLAKQPSLTPSGLLSAFEGLGEQRGQAAGPYRFTQSEPSGKYFYFPIIMKRVQGTSVVELK